MQKVKERRGIHLQPTSAKSAQGWKDAADGILDAAMEIAKRHEEILERLRVAVRKDNPREIVRIAKELVREKSD